MCDTYKNNKIRNIGSSTINKLMWLFQKQATYGEFPAKEILENLGNLEFPKGNYKNNRNL